MKLNLFYCPHKNIFKFYILTFAGLNFLTQLLAQNVTDTASDGAVRSLQSNI